MNQVTGLSREDKSLCEDFGIKSEVKIVLVKLNIPPEKKFASKLFERNISSDPHRPASKETKNVQTRKKIINCSDCQYSTWKTSRLTAHMRTHTRDQNFKCTHNDCSSKMFSSKGHLMSHMKAHTRDKTGRKTHSCTFCSQKYQYSFQLSSHMWKHTGEKPFYCEMCKQGFTTQTAKRKHETAHCKLRPSTSGSSISVKTTVDNYWSNWRKTRFLLQCEWCEYFTTRNYEFEKHMATHTETRFACSECQRKFSTKTALKRHTKIHRGKLYKCPHCEFRSAHCSGIPKHVASMHNKETRKKNFVCGTCSKAYFTKDKLQHHNKQHSINRTYYACQFCHNKFTENFSKTSHERRCKSNPNHTKNLFKCEACQFETIWKAGLERHVKTHTGEKPFACALCPYKCSEKHVLENHIRRHTGEKNYKCKYCEYSCTSSGSMDRHVRTHTKEKPYKCKECDFSTAHQGYLSQHLLRHEGIKPHSCTDCNYKSAAIGDVRRHWKSMHT